MAPSIALAIDVEAAPDRVFEVLSTSDGQRAFWTEDCDVSAEGARFGFVEAPVDLEVDVHLETDRLVRMTVTSGFPFWDGSIWEWVLTPASEGAGTGILFRHHGFGDGYSEGDLAHTAQSWAMILDRLATYLATGEPQPFFVAAPQ